MLQPLAFVLAALPTSDAPTLGPALQLRTPDGPLEVPYYAGPLVFDADGEGALDLVVGDLQGTLHVFTARRDEPGCYDPEGALENASGKIRLHNW